jgi:hypothetical protein
VRGDPGIPITLAMYRSRETFMLDALAFRGEITTLMERQRIGARIHRAPARALLPRPKRSCETLAGP